MTLRQFTVDVADAPDQLSEAIEANIDAEDALLEKVAERFPEDGFYDEECPSSFEDKFYELREQRADLESKRARIETFLNGTEEDPQASEWSHHEFVFQEPSTSDALYAEGRSTALAEEAQKRGEAIDGRSFGVTQLLERCRVDAPPEAPDDLASGLPHQVGEWLLDELNSRITAGMEQDLGNASPQEALMNSDSWQQDS